MSIIVYAESWEGKFRKSTFEAISYAKKISEGLQKDVKSICVGSIDEDELKKLGHYGSSSVDVYPNISKSDCKSVAEVINEHSQEANFIIFSNTFNAKSIAPRVSAKLSAGLVSNVISNLEDVNNPTFKRQSFSSKAIETVKLNTNQAVISIAPNSFKLVQVNTDCTININQKNFDSDLTVISKDVNKGKISLSEAEIVVSAGRGLKGPENWEMIESLADILGAATACSKPVSDIGWRPHSEHVGQTGKAVAPNLYIAIGISGAIQHLAGVNSSKVMVAINTDPEAPFFKAADYGIVGDAFEVVPKLTEEIKKLRNN
ncbi:MAG: electron transfer flavoprotein subunit alpha/FixB family protein [Flavobacteriales bacterium]